MPNLRLTLVTQDLSPEERRFDADAVSIGRADDADIPVFDGRVSRRHARLFWRDGAWLVEDLGSRNGTLLNGGRITAPTRVQPDDVVRVGWLEIRVEPTRPARPVPANSTTDRAVAPAELPPSIMRPAAELIPPADETAAIAPRFQVVIDLHRALAASISHEQLFEALLRYVFEVLRPEQGAILLRGPGGEAERVAERRLPAAGDTPPVSRRLASEVIDRGAAALVVDAQDEERPVPSEGVALSDVRSTLAAPIADLVGSLGMIALFSRLHVRRFSEADLQLLVSIGREAALRVRNVSLMEDAAERRATEREMALARGIQKDALPRSLPQRSDVDLAGRVRPGREVGGDLYDVLLDGDHLWFAVIDVSGKGSAAARLMTVTKTLFRDAARSGASLAETVGAMNRGLARDARDHGRVALVTALAGRLDLATGRLQLVNAGHAQPYRVARGGEAREEPVAGALALGVLDDVEYPVTEVALAAGDLLIACTDGVVSAVNAAGERLGVDGVLEALRGAAAEAPTGVVTALFDRVDRFVAGAVQEDDQAVFAIQYRGASAGAAVEPRKREENDDTNRFASARG